MERPNWLERLAGSTRLEVLVLLLESERTVQEIADAVGVSANAIRGHLGSLERDGLVVQAGTRRDTGGKPAAVYAVSAEADELFPKAYASMLAGLIAVLEERLGPDGVEKVLREVGARAATPASGSPGQRLDAAAAALRALGARVEVRRTRAGFRIQGFACPASALTREDERAAGSPRWNSARAPGWRRA